MVVTVLVAVLGISGTATAGKYVYKSHGDRDGDWVDKSDKNGKKKWKKGKKHHGNHGENGHPGPGNPPPTAPPADYGIATVSVTRGGNTAVWATYSTALGSPVGDTTGGTFRFTCSTANAPCTVSVGAAALSATAGTVPVYPRVLIYRQDYDEGGPSEYCEYGDGSTNTLPLAVATQPSTATPSYTAVPLQIGGSADCGLGGPAGNVNEIIVPSGYYDVHSTFTFLP